MDTFFTIYFIIVGVLFTLNLIYKLIKFVKSDGEDWQLHLAEDVINWFIKMHPIKKKSPRIVLSDNDSLNCGTYHFYTNTITLYTKHLSTYRQLAEITIHELMHWHQITSLYKDQLYDKQLKEYGYENHPQEIWCRAVAAELTKHYIKQRI
jgi:hypothetical protein